MKRQHTISTTTSPLRESPAARKGGFLLAVVVLLFAVPACGNAAGLQENEVQAIPINTTLDNIDDGDITDAAMRELRADARTLGTSVSGIDIVTIDGIVTLTGDVDNILVRDRATRIIESIKGVRSVVNRISVRPTHRSDEDLVGAVRRAFKADPATEPWKINTQASDGLITLTGTVHSWHERSLAESVAKTVAGVTGVRNDIKVDDTTMRGDTEIAEDVESVLRWDARIDDALIDVDVDDGTVNLTGSVGSAHERSLAIADAYVSGVTGVEASGLDVRWWARDQMRRTEWASTRSDKDVTDAVSDALLRDPRVSSFGVDVNVIGGVASVSGTVDNLKARQAAAQDARNTIGVRAIANDIDVVPGIGMTDLALAEMIKARIDADPYVTSSQITVDVTDGQATLSGKVETYFESWEAGDIAARVRGVRSVENELSVSYAETAYDPLIESWDPVSFDVDYHALKDLTDGQIKDSVEREIWWSPYIKEDKVSVTVKDGVARLKGTVDTWEQRELATVEALEGGALDVENMLRIDDNPL